MCGRKEVCQNIPEMICKSIPSLASVLIIRRTSGNVGDGWKTPFPCVGGVKNFLCKGRNEAHSEK